MTPNETLKWEAGEVHIPRIPAGMLKINGGIQTRQSPLQIEPCVNDTEPRRAPFAHLNSCVELVNAYSREALVWRHHVCIDATVCAEQVTETHG